LAWNILVYKEKISMSSKYIMTVDWCNKGHRGIFSDRDGNCNWKPEGPHTQDEMERILGLFSLILNPKSELFTEDELKQYHLFYPLAEYMDEYGIVCKKVVEDENSSNG